jgi:hypothetical protein
MNTSYLKIMFSLLLVVFSAQFTPVGAAMNAPVNGQPALQIAKNEGPSWGKAKRWQKISKRFTAIDKMKIDGLAVAVLVGGIVSFLLFFPLKIFYAFVVVGLATLVMGFFALRKLRRRDDIKGKWMAWLGIAFVVVPALFIGLVLYALSQW